MNRLLLCLLFLCFGSLPLRANEVIWSGLIYGHDEKSAEHAPAELGTLNRKLKRVFGYNHFCLIGEHRSPMKGDHSQKWLIPGKPFSLSVHSGPATADGYKLDLELFQDKRLLVKTGATLKRGCPVLIKGPQCAQGQLIIAVAVE